MPQFDPNILAHRALRASTTRAARFEALRRQEFFRQWREARAESRKQPTARVKLGPRVQYPKLSPTELARVGELPPII